MKTILKILILLIVSNSLIAQVKESEILSNNKLGQASFIKLKETKISDEKNSIDDFIKKQFKSDENTKFETYNAELDNNTLIENKKLKQFYKGIPVEFGELVITSKNGNISTINGNYVPIKNFDITPEISKSQALDFVLNKINAEKYAWEDSEFENLNKNLQNNQEATYYPKGELVIIDKNIFDDINEIKLAYKFEIYALHPLSRAYYYIDANTGDLLFEDSIIKHVEGTTSTRYSGTRTIETQQIGSIYRLRDYSRGNGIETFNMQNGGSYTNAVDYNDNDNNWTTSEFHNSNKDDAALDAHWGAEKTYDYFYNQHNRNSYDNQGSKLINYVNANLPLINSNYQNNDNAFWNGQFMTYGTGQFSFDALTSIDVIAHEIGHGVCSSTANLVYQNESGAINESLSDIWGAMVEFYAAPEKQTYLIGEDIIYVGGALRNMANPNARNQPDT